MTLPERISALVADVPDIPLTTLDKAAGLGRGTLSKLAAGGWENPGGAIVGRVALLFGASTDHVLLGVGRKPARATVAASVERAMRRAGIEHAPTVRATMSSRKATRPRSAARSAGARS